MYVTDVLWPAALPYVQAASDRKASHCESRSPSSSSACTHGRVRCQIIISAGVGGGGGEGGAEDKNYRALSSFAHTHKKGKLI